MGQTNEILSCGVIMSKDKPFKTLETLLALNLAYKEFVDSPTDKNLETFLNLSAQYKESWIIDASNKNISDSVSSKDLDAESDLRKELAEFDEEISGESLKKEVEQGDLGDGILSLTRRDALKYITKDRIGIHVSGSGLVKLMTSSIYIPPIKQFGGRDMHFCQHDFRGSTFNYSKGKPFNRRWYVSAEGPDEPKLPWNIIRDDFNGIIKSTDNDAGFTRHLDDERIDEYRIIFSGDKTRGSQELENIFNEITLSEERSTLKDCHFVVFESDYFKYPMQYFNYPDGGKPLWRDICFFNEDNITFRSTTTDVSFKPNIPIPGSNHWVLSNNMPTISNQAMRCFLEKTNPRLIINEGEN